MVSVVGRHLAIVACILPLLLADGVDAGYAQFSVSAYDDSSGVPPWGITASGLATELGMCACGPAWEFGTAFVLSDGQTLTCTDRGGAITDRHIDVWMESRDAALRWGRRTMRALWVR